MVINLKPQSMGKTSRSTFHLNISGEINYNFLLLLKHSNKSPFPILEKSQKDLNPKQGWRYIDGRGFKWTPLPEEQKKKYIYIYSVFNFFFFDPLKYKLEHPDPKKEEEENKDDNIERFTMQD